MNIRVIIPTHERLKIAEKLLDQALNVLMAKVPSGQACSLIIEIGDFLTIEL